MLAGKDGLSVGGAEEKGAVLYALPADTKDPPTEPAALSLPGPRTAAVAEPLPSIRRWHAPGYERAERPLCRVWRRPG